MKENKKMKNKKNKNRELQLVMYFFFLLFLGMIGYFIYFQVAKSTTFINNPYNKLPDVYADHVIRGRIESTDGYVLAESLITENGEEERIYPYKEKTAHVVGYAVNGKAGIEKQANISLLTSNEFFVKRIADDLSGKKSTADTVVLNLNYMLQECCYNALADYDGAVVVMEPKTGKILAMVSKPDFDPNALMEEWETINEKGSTVLFNRATQGSYTPGSVFKIFTTLAYYREHNATDEGYTFSCEGQITKDGKTIHCASNHKHGTENLLDSFANSCNASYANLGVDLNVENWSKLCDSLLFNQNLPIAFESGVSSFSLQENDSVALRMETAIGQGRTTVSPLHMVMIMSAIANDGVLMTPYLIDHIENTDSVCVQSYSPKEHQTLLSQKEAAFLQEYLAQVVSEGTGKKLQSDRYQAFGKTGTAQVSDQKDTTNAWFVGYAKQEGYEDLAIAVVVENSGSGSTYAVPIAKKVFDLYFGQ